MNTQNITSNSTERWTTARLIRPDGIVEIYSNYMVSDQGRIGSLVDSHGNKRKVMKILKPSPCDKLGHLRVWLCANGKKYQRSVHRLVLSSFHPEQYFKDAEADHIDRDVTNNYLVNLRWIDRKGNIANRSNMKQIRVTHLSDGQTELFDSMTDCSRIFRKNLKWCINIIRKHKGFHKSLNILIEKI